MPSPALPAELSRADLPEREFLDLLKSFLSDVHSAAREEQRQCLCGGIEACRKVSDAMDAILSVLHDRARVRFLASAPDLSYRMSVVAVGGYGRRELCPRSDVDLLFLHAYKVDRYVEAMTEWMLYPLWDLGLDVGHSVRNIKETIRLAGADDSIRTALLDHRFVTGDGVLYRESAKDLDRFLYFSDGDRFIGKKIREMRARHAKVGSTVYLLEPNVKEGRGGLRDLQTAVWGARIKYKCAGLSELRRKGVVGGRTVEAIRHVLDYLLRVRNELHSLQGKKSDVLSYEFQEPMAERFRYRRLGPNQAVERFMRAYYLHAASAARLSDEVLEEVGRFLPEEGSRKPFFFLKRKLIGEGGILYKGKLQVKDRASFEREPIRILEFFRSMQKTRSALSLQARRNVLRALPAIGESFRADPGAAKLFLEILADPVHLRETLLAMNESRFLARYIPEFAPLYCKVQRDIYHVYTVDVHSIRAAAVLAAIGAAPVRTTEEERFLRIHEGVPDRGLLHLAILFHDIGKGKGHGHSRIGAGIVAEIGKRFGLPGEKVSDLVFLVEHHLLMANVSQRRDLHDIELILSFAETVGTVSRLDQLYLLTYSDMKEVAPEVWTQWKAMLLSELYEKARNVLEQGALKRPFEEMARRRREQVRELLAGEPREAVDRFLSRMDDRYLLATPDARFAAHCRILAAFDGKTPSVAAIDSKESGTTEFLVVCPDERGLFAKIAGTLSANGLNILTASIATTVDGVALDTFHAGYRGGSLEGDPKKERVIADLSRILRGVGSVEGLLAESRTGKFVRDRVPKYRPTRVVFDNSVSSRCTVIDIFTYDRIGLLYDITSTLASMGIDIVLSKISTKADQVADVFYVVDRDGGKVESPGRQEEIRAALLASIGAGSV
ncbi:MAG: [protein-PII] uridylyltransferase [Deltaproteobacteria bacterium]